MRRRRAASCTRAPPRGRGRSYRTRCVVRRGRAALREHSAVEQPAELLRDEARQRRVVVARAEKRREVIAHHAMQRRLLRVVRRGVLSSGARAGASSVGARRHAERPCKPRYDPLASELQRKHPSAAGVAAAWRRCTPGERAPSFDRGASRASVCRVASSASSSSSRSPWMPRSSTPSPPRALARSERRPSGAGFGFFSSPPAARGRSRSRRCDPRARAPSRRCTAARARRRSATIASPRRRERRADRRGARHGGPDRARRAGRRGPGAISS